MSSPPDTWSERSTALARLLARVALGDRAALAALYRDTSAHLFGVILRIQPDRAHAEDLLQEIYISIWNAARSFDAARSQPLTWLTSIARNRAIDSLRRRRTEPVTVSLVMSGEEVDGAVPSAPEPPSGEPGPLDLLLQAAQARELGHCVQQLSAEQQQCMALTYYQGLSHAEVAQHLGQPLGTVKSWVRRALMALKDCLGRSAASAAGG